MKTHISWFNRYNVVEMTKTIGFFTLEQAKTGTINYRTLGRNVHESLCPRFFIFEKVIRL